MAGDGARPTLGSILLQWEVEQFLYREAELLDARRFDEWLELFTDDAHYWMPLRLNRDRREEASDESGPGELSMFDDDKPFLAARIRRLHTGRAWAEDPPSRTRHLITNVRIEGAGAELMVRSNFVVYRNRLADEVDLYAGAREDVLRRLEGRLRIAKRKILLDQNVLLSKNLAVFF
jgi:3-phenylpropionate/cinnamic acid dioxygenase small subunit